MIMYISMIIFTGFYVGIAEDNAHVGWCFIAGVFWPICLPMVINQYVWEFKHK